MRKSNLLVGSTLFAVAVAIAGPAYAQDAAAPAAECVDDNVNGVCDSDEQGGAIIVTGTRIARPTLSSSIPLTSVTTEDLTGTGEVSLGDALNDLPSLRSTFSSGNSTRFIGTAGLAILDLRGLGTDRTLVLVNGRRHVTATPGDNGFDVNTVPIDLVDRIDIVTGGNSAVYGSDAVAGVVNFVMKRDYDGFELSGQSNISSRGDRGSYSLSAIAGTNFADGRGNIAAAFEYTRQQPLYMWQRDSLTGAFSGRCQYQLTDVTTGEPAAGDGIADTTFLCGIKNAAISDGGTVGLVNSATGAYLRFDNSGNAFVDTPPTTFRSVGSGNQQGGFGSTLRNTGSLLAEVDRYAANLFGHFDVSEAFKPFFEAKYVRTVVSGEGQPSFFNSVPGTLGGPAMRCDNAFLSAASLQTLRNFGLCANLATGTFPLARFNTDFGGRQFHAVRETYRGVAGVTGNFNDDWNYEVAVNYGRFTSHGRNTNNLLLFDLDGNPAGFNLAVDAVRPTTGPNAGQIVCRVNAVTTTAPGCVPINVLGSGQPSAAALAYVHADGTTEEFADQFVASVNLGGDLSQLFELPGGPISFALGAEYREERASVDYDDVTSSGGTFLNALQDFNPPKLTVKELYGEMQLPIFENSALGREFVVTVAGRMSDYNNATGTVYAYNIQGVYAPIEDVRLRVAYATSVRAPTQGDLYSPQSQNFANGLGDPCDSNSITGGPNRAANCAAAGVPTVANAATVATCASSSFPTTLGAPWRNCLALTSGTSFVSGGNPTLQEERGRSLTIGAVIEPRVVPGLSLTVDYYDIKVKNLIAALSAQSIITLCYDSPSGINNAYCATVNRDAATGMFADPAVISGGINFAEQRTRGVDFDLAYNHSFDNGDRLKVRLIATRVIELNNYTDPTAPTVPNRQLSELGDPQWSANASVSYDFGNFDILYAVRYIGKQTISNYEAQNSYIGLCPASGSTTLGTCTAGQLTTLPPTNADAFPQVWYPTVFYHDIRMGFDIADKFRLYMGVSNVFDTQPPLGLLGTAGGDPYDSFGRNFFVGFNAEF